MLTFALISMQRLLAHFYMEGSDAIQFTSELTSGRSETYWDKLVLRVRALLPRDLQTSEGMSLVQVQVQEKALEHFFSFLRGLLALPSD